MNIAAEKERQQAAYLERLKQSGKDERTRIVLEHSGFASWVRKNRGQITIVFGAKKNPHNGGL